MGDISSVLDLGGGTGAAAWAALEQWPDAQVTVLDRVGQALDLGRRLRAGEPGDVDFRSWLVGRPLPTADLVTVSYVLSELTEADREQIIGAASAAARHAVAVIEPGTPDGYRRVLAAREALLSAGWQVVAPCPHQHACPLTANDWCHFSARVERSSLHRRLKGGDLGHEDEKFSYVVAVAPAAAAEAAQSRILRHPVKRKGLVEFQLCLREERVARQVVSKRQGPLYRAARDAEWGDAWPPGADSGRAD